MPALKIRKPNLKRTGERLIRLEAMAARIRAGGDSSNASAVQALSSQAGNIGRAMDRKYNG